MLYRTELPILCLGFLFWDFLNPGQGQISSAELWDIYLFLGAIQCGMVTSLVKLNVYDHIKHINYKIAIF